MPHLVNLWDSAGNLVCQGTASTTDRLQGGFRYTASLTGTNVLNPGNYTIAAYNPNGADSMVFSASRSVFTNAPEVTYLEGRYGDGTNTIPSEHYEGQDEGYFGPNFLFAALGGSATAPQITAQPQSVTNVVGGTANFTVTATGTAPLSYQWRKEGVAIVNATNSAFSLQPLALSHAGSYTVVVSNSVNSITSAVAVLMVTNPVAVPLPANCVAWWRAENNFLDVVGANHGTGMNGVTFASGEVGSGFSFVGNNGYVSAVSYTHLTLPTNREV